MIAAVLVALVSESERSQQMVTVLIFGLLIVAALLGGLTAWYWQRTNPRRRARQLRLQGGGIDVNTRQMDDLHRPPNQGSPGVLAADPFTRNPNGGGGGGGRSRGGRRGGGRRGPSGGPGPAPRGGGRPSPTGGYRLQ